MTIWIGKMMMNPTVQLSIPMRPPVALHRCNWNDAWQIQRWRVVLANSMANLALRFLVCSIFWSSAFASQYPMMSHAGKGIVVWKWVWSAVVSAWMGGPNLTSWDRFVWRTKPVKLVIQDVNATGAHCESGNGSGWLKLDGNEAVRCSTL